MKENNKFEITDKFDGGNVKIISIENNIITFEPDYRDSDEWFYWAFAVKNAKPGQTYTFKCTKSWIGYFGPAVSYDNDKYEWLNKNFTDDSFSYTFGENEKTVYFAHHILYHPKRFFDFCKKNDLKIETLAISEKGREIPFLKIGVSNETVLITARHHCCESTGSYLLEGFVSEWLKSPLEKYSLIVVPFVDYDGVCNGDQGKGRHPFDHNRDYSHEGESIYASIRAIKNLTKKYKIKYAFDCHSPWHKYWQNDTVFLPIKFVTIEDKIREFSKCFEEECDLTCAPHFAKDDYPPNKDWNKVGGPSFSTYMHDIAGADISTTIETAYFKSNEVMINDTNVVNTGKALFRGLKKYHFENK